MNKSEGFIKIGDLIETKEATIQTGPFGTQLKASEYVESGIPLLNVKNIGYGDVRVEGLEFISERKAEALSAHILKKNDIVFGRKGAVERHAFIDETSDGWAQGSDCLRLRIDSERVSNKFISYYFKTAGHKDWMQAVCSFGATMTSLNQDIVKRISIPLPPIKTQKKIAAVLSAYDDLIENNKRRIALLEKMAEEIYREWFVRMRFPGYKETKFEKGVPVGWDIKKFREITDYYIGGGWGEENESTTFNKGAFVIRGTDIPKLNAGELSNEVYRFHKPSNLKSRKLEPNDFIFEVSGGSKDQLLGRNIMLTEKLLGFFENNVMCASFCKLIRFNKVSISPYFMKYYLKFYYEYDLVGIYQVQSTGISNYQFESFLSYQTLFIPPKPLQDAFDNLVKPILAKKDDLSLAVNNLKKTRDLLLSRLISGKLSVENLDIQFPLSMQEVEHGVIN